MSKPTGMFIIIVILQLLIVSSAGATVFKNMSSPYPVSLSPYSPHAVVTADINGDGYQDAAITMDDGSTARVDALLWNSTTGTLDYSVIESESLATFGPRGIVAADLNLDGKVDLAVANFSDNSVSVFIGNGNGTFQPRVNYSLGSGAGPIAIVRGDFKGNGIKDDLAVLNSTGNSVAILLNDGTGTMTVLNSATWSATMSSPSAIAAGDFNGDDITDIAVSGSSGNVVRIFRGAGAVGTFMAGTDVAVGNGPLAVTTADFDSDGFDDLAVLKSVVGTDAAVSIIHGNREWSFAVENTYVVTDPADNTANPVALISADMDRDGITDLAVANKAKDALAVLRGNGDGTFKTAESFVVGTAPSGLAAGDMDGSGNDLLSISGFPENSYSLLANTTVAQPGIKVSPPAYDFGTFESGHAMYIANPFIVTNPGSADLTISSMDFAAPGSDFQLYQGTCAPLPRVIAAGESCAAEVRFMNPFTAGLKSAAMEIVSDAVSQPVVTVPLTGTAVLWSQNSIPYTASLKFIGRGSGSVNFVYLDSCTSDCSHTFAEGATATLVAVPATGYYFYGWTGCDSYWDGTCQITMNSDKRITANFGFVHRMVKLNTSNPVYTATAAAAYAVAGNDEEIWTPSGQLYEGLDMNRNVRASIVGGWNSSFTLPRGEATILGSLTISRGTATVDNIVLK